MAVTTRLDEAFGAPKVESFALKSRPDGQFSAPLGDSADFAYAIVYPFPALERRCHSNSLCALFGGASATELAFTGWTYSARNENGEPVNAEPMKTAEAVTIGSTTTMFPGIVTRTGAGCASSVGVANMAGTIMATFDDYADDGAESPEPAPGRPLAIVLMSAGTTTSSADGCG